MRLLREEKGIALVTALMLTLITLGISMITLYMITQNIKLSGSQKAYKNSLDAGLGGVDIVTKDAIPYLLQAANGLLTAPTDNFGLIFQGNLGAQMPGLASLSILNDKCLYEKLTTRTNTWDAACVPESRGLDATKSPDISFILNSTIPGAAANGFKVWAKIVSTTVGTSDLSGRSYNTSSTTSAPGGDVGSPYIYRLEVTGERASNPKERASLSVLYAY